MRPRLSFLLLPALLIFCNGCVNTRQSRHVLAASEMALDTFAMLEQATQPPPDDPPPAVVEVVYVQSAPTPAPAPAPAYLPPADSTRPAPVAFDLNAAKTSLAGVDTAACKSSGLDGGYARATVTFVPSGAVDAVTLDLPAGSAPAARDCLDTAFHSARVPAFSGSVPMSVHRTFYIS